MFLHADKNPAACQAWNPESSAVGDCGAFYFVPGGVRDWLSAGMGRWEWVIAFSVCWHANIGTVAHYQGPLPLLLFCVCKDHKVQGLKQAHFGLSPEFHQLHQVEVFHQ